METQGTNTIETRREIDLRGLIINSVNGCGILMNICRGMDIPSKAKYVSTQLLRTFKIIENEVNLVSLYIMVITLLISLIIGKYFNISNKTLLVLIQSDNKLLY